MRVLSSLLIVVSVALSVNASSVIRREEEVVEDAEYFYNYDVCVNVVPDDYRTKIFNFEDAIDKYQGNVASASKSAVSPELTDKYNVATAAFEKSLGFCCSDSPNPIISSDLERKALEVLNKFSGATYLLFLTFAEKEPKFRDSPVDYDFAKKVLTSMEGPAKKLLGCLSAHVNGLYDQNSSDGLLDAIGRAQAAYKLNSTATTPAA